MAETEHTSRTIVLKSGDRIPAIGLGTWRSNGDQVREAVQVALQAGYRHIDTAFAYGNEKEVGQGIKLSSVDRDDIWLTTKLEDTWHKRVPEAIAESLKNLDTHYVDLFLMHWPASLDPADRKKAYEDWDFRDTWREMEKLLKTGQVKNIGVSNFSITNLEKLLADPSLEVLPAVNQIELHPSNPSPKLVEFCKSKGIHVTGYSCLGSVDSPLYKNEKLLSIATQKHKTPQQVLLAWGLQHGWSIVPKSVTASRIRSNFELGGWSLDESEVKSLDSITDRYKVCVAPYLPFNPFDGKDE